MNLTRLHILRALHSANPEVKANMRSKMMITKELMEHHSKANILHRERTKGGLHFLQTLRALHI